LQNFLIGNNMCEQQFQAEVMDELAMDDYPSDIVDRELEEVCVYCGSPKINNWTSCCGEVHFCHTRD
jgi:hypothetical protein